MGEVKKLLNRRHHIHHCPGGTLGEMKLDYVLHRGHWWLCWNPECPAGDDYVCGLYQDAVNCYQAQQMGKTGGKGHGEEERQRGRGGRWTRGAIPGTDRHTSQDGEEGEPARGDGPGSERRGI